MTCSVGFRVPSAEGLSVDLFQRLADADGDDVPPRLYRDPAQPAVENPGQVPASLVEFARQAVQRRLQEPDALERALGEALTEPKPRVWFAASGDVDLALGVALDRRTRMMYDDRHLFINGEAFRISGRDARLLRRLADVRVLGAGDCAALSAEAQAVVCQWLASGWLVSPGPVEPMS